MKIQIISNINLLTFCNKNIYILLFNYLEFKKKGVFLGKDAMIANISSLTCILKMMKCCLRHMVYVLVQIGLCSKKSTGAGWRLYSEEDVEERKDTSYK
ncbi:hypothetical protein [Candidatus Absconditicoccus praedator]|uniref:hypothetical protein n=1 Tax=Candidatus Absconditicoccus praedator TaxID=2735562 RepID=UPI001E30652A|nr:hypothetical protein [Candidatus Absconditicoccus praedator]UFX83409.1 hypothetical protein HLG78_04750 [Candidatus Absconditicoccus praedator]